MSSGFFTKKAVGKRKSGGGGGGASSSSSKQKRPKRPDPMENEEILSDASDVEGRPDAGYESDGVGEEQGPQETAEEKRHRLAKAYLEEIEKEELDRARNASSDLHDAVNLRLKRDNLEDSGKLVRPLASTCLAVEPETIRFHRDHKVHKQTLTCLVLSPDNRHFFTASKDCGLVKWDLATGQRLLRLPGGRPGQEATHKGHCTTVNAMAISSDGKFLASGDNSKLIRIWNPSTFDLLRTFRGHKAEISGLAFRKRSHTLFSCAYDRYVKIWNLDEMAYVETLQGHAGKITSIDAGLRERCITSSKLDKDGGVRIWKIVEESNMKFPTPENVISMDEVKMINEEQFVTYGEAGYLSVWGLQRNKPLCTETLAHGKDEDSGEPFLLSSVAVMPMSDLIATGSNDGFVRLWKCGNNFRKLAVVQKIPLPGFVNGLAFTSDGRFLLAAVGKEHRLGKWSKLKEVKNGVAVIPLQMSEDGQDNGKN